MYTLFRKICGEKSYVLFSMRYLFLTPFTSISLIRIITARDLLSTFSPTYLNLSSKFSTKYIAPSKTSQRKQIKYNKKAIEIRVSLVRGCAVYIVYPLFNRGKRRPIGAKWHLIDPAIILRIDGRMAVT